jgi:GT2 family glycosyltransferase
MVEPGENHRYRRESGRHMTTSVIIATYNRAAHLCECLEHLSRQPFARGDEVIVADNGSTDSTVAVIERQRRSFPVPLRYVEERRPGKSHALARALEMARGDLLAFTDDDVNVDPGWLGEVRAAMRAGDVALLGGPVVPRWERGTPRWLRLRDDGYGRMAAPLALLDYGCQPVDLGARSLLGANLAVRRDVLQQVGGFALHLGKVRGTLLSGEDHELCQRVQAAGFKAIYCPNARVRHWVPADRMRIWYFLSWFFWSGITNAAVDETRGQPSRSFFGIPPYLLRRAAASSFGALIATGTGRFSVAVDRAVDVAFAAGYVAQRWGLVARTRPSSHSAEEPA